MVVECQLINVEGKTEFKKNHHLPLIIKLDSGKYHQWRLQLIGEFVGGQDIWTFKKYFLIGHLLISKGKMLTLLWRNLRRKA